MGGGKYSGTMWIAIVFMAGAPAFAIDRARLDRCQAQLGACYDQCKSRGTDPKVCNQKCSTGRCGLYWDESYGAFLDRRIEENAAGTQNGFVGLKRLKGRRGQDPQPSEGRAPVQDFLSLFGLR
jgi:hypothetical protein